jgi:hypothetical protein
MSTDAEAPVAGVFDEMLVELKFRVAADAVEAPKAATAPANATARPAADMLRASNIIKIPVTAYPGE